MCPKVLQARTDVMGCKQSVWHTVLMFGCAMVQPVLDNVLWCCRRVVACLSLLTIVLLQCFAEPACWLSIGGGAIWCCSQGAVSTASAARCNHRACGFILHQQRSFCHSCDFMEIFGKTYLWLRSGPSLRKQFLLRCALFRTVAGCQLHAAAGRRSRAEVRTAVLLLCIPMCRLLQPAVPPCVHRVRPVLLQTATRSSGTPAPARGVPGFA